MIYLKNKKLYKLFFQFFFIVFIFFNILYCNNTIVNNIFHLSLFFFFLFLLSDKKIRKKLFQNKVFNLILFLISITLIYFCTTEFWYKNKIYILKNFIHSFYIISFILMFRVNILFKKKFLILITLSLSTLLVFILTVFLSKKNELFICRLKGNFLGFPRNSIDLAGYFSLSILFLIILIKDTKYNLLYIPIILLFLGIVLTQSRGPLISLIISIIILLFYNKKNNLNIKIILFLFTIILLFFLFFLNLNKIFLDRIKNIYNNFFIRIDIWIHTLKLSKQKLFFGWGLSKKLDYINIIGEKITTTHSLYLSSLLKGGLIGLTLLLLIIIYLLKIIIKQLYNKKIEGIVFIYSIIFYFSQGMFIINNPGLSWQLFWIPISLTISLID